MVQDGPPYFSIKKKFQVDSESKDMEESTIFSENIFNLTWCTNLKMLGADRKILGANHPTHHTHHPIQPANQPNRPTDNF